MDERIDNIRKTFQDTSKTSIDTMSEIPRKRFFANNSMSIPKAADNSVDLDFDEPEEKNFNFNSSLTDIANSKLEYRNKLISNLQNARDKVNNEMVSLEKKSKYNRHTIAIKNDVAKTVELLSSPDITKSKTNYRTICDEINSKTSKDSIIIGNKLNTSGFLSLSRQSLNDNLNESGISNTASRISGNLLKRTLSQRKEMSEESDSKSFAQISSSTPIANRRRRYRTVVKKDRFSAYLTRESNQDNIFSVPSQITNRNVALNLNLAESSDKRIDFSKIMRFTKDKTFDKSEPPNLTSYWNCNNCDSSNPSNFNFCPTCSASNPKLTVMKDRTVNRLDEVDSRNWICPRCSTKNDEIRMVCIFCFKNKNEFSDTKKHFIKRPKLSDDCNETESRGGEQPMSNFGQETSKKWTCPECWAESNADVESCPCCNATNPSSKPKIGDIKQTLKFGTDRVDPEKEKFLFGSQVKESPIKFGTSDKSGKKWTCDTCWAESDEGVQACPCCNTKNPSSKANPADVQQTFKFGTANVEISSEKPKIIFGNTNEETKLQESSFVFGAKKDDDKPSFMFGAKKNETNGQKAGPIFGKVGTSGKKWDCPTCLVENNPEIDSCPCCNTKNPSAKAKPADVQPSFKFGTSNLEISSEKPKIMFGAKKDDNKPSLVFGAKKDETNGQKAGPIFGKVGAVSASGSKWDCPTCLVENDPEIDSCPCCNTKNPSAKANPVDVKQTFKFGTSNVENSSEKPKIMFGNPKEEAQPQTPSFVFGAKKDETSGQKAGPIFGKVGVDSTSGKKWDCPTCLVENNPEIDSCPCCNTKNPSAKSSDVQPSFKFGTSRVEISNPEKPKITFGNPKEEAQPQKPSLVFGSKKDDDKPSLVFGAKKDDDKPSLVFGAKKDDDKPSLVFGSRKEETNGQKVGPIFGKVVSTSANKWNCPTCLVENTQETVSCPCCATKRPASIVPTQPADIVSKEGGSNKWSCPTCLVDNEESDPACVCCTEKNPNKKGGELKQSGLKFDLPRTSLSQSEIKFGSSEMTADVTGIVSSSFNWGSLKATGKVGSKDSATSGFLPAAVLKDRNDNSTNTSGTGKSFLFGAPNGGSTSGGFNVPQLNTNKPDKVANNTVFQFGKVSTNKTGPENGDSELHYDFSQPEMLDVSTCADVPVDLVFEFSDPLHF